MNRDTLAAIRFAKEVRSDYISNDSGDPKRVETILERVDVKETLKGENLQHFRV